MEHSYQPQQTWRHVMNKINIKTLTLLVKMTNIIVRHLINWEGRNNMHKEMESSVFFSIFQLMQFMKYQGMKRMEELDIKPSQAGILFSLSYNANK